MIAVAVTALFLSIGLIVALVLCDSVIKFYYTAQALTRADKLTKDRVGAAVTRRLSRSGQPATGLRRTVQHRSTTRTTGPAVHHAAA